MTTSDRSSPLSRSSPVLTKVMLGSASEPRTETPPCPTIPFWSTVPSAAVVPAPKVPEVPEAPDAGTVETSLTTTSLSGAAKSSAPVPVTSSLGFARKPPGGAMARTGAPGSAGTATPS